MRRWKAAKALLNDDITMYPSYRTKEKELKSLIAKKAIYWFIEIYLSLMAVASLLVLSMEGSRFIDSHHVLEGVLMFVAALVALVIALIVLGRLDSNMNDIKGEMRAIKQQLKYNRALDMQRRMQSQQTRF
jgi:hypothetical protein